MLAYDRGWAAVNKMLRAGKAFSGNERKSCFLNVGGERFANVSAAMSLDLADDGRGLSLVDWDHDGDLDMWMTCRTSPSVKLLVNESQSQNGYLLLRLQGKTCNRDAIGARVEVYRAADDRRPQLRTLRAGDGYLAQSTKWLHFGAWEPIRASIGSSCGGPAERRKRSRD
jgi:hypothetical protein